MCNPLANTAELPPLIQMGASQGHTHISSINHSKVKEFSWPVQEIPTWNPLTAHFRHKDQNALLSMQDFDT